jgi:GH15 family glucan-1,4-alpha-glucosidase
VLEEARAWQAWLQRSVAGSPDQIQIVYGLSGERHLLEWEVPWLPGYHGAAPVRIGNAAAGQLQLDVFGELVDAVYQARKHFLAPAASAWAQQQTLIGHLEDIWELPDHDIWGLVMRYRTSPKVDGLPPGEGVFLPCSFWLADNYTLQNRHAEARALFERLLSLRNDVGLLAEEYDPRTRRLVGNFPQAFSHIALIGTALNLHAVGPARQRDPETSPRAGFSEFCMLKISQATVIHS